MRKINISIAGNTYKVSVAENEEQREKGLQGVKELASDEGMLFIFQKSEEVSIWMKDTLIPLDIIFIDSDLNVINVHQGNPETEDMMTEKDVSYVLEVNVESGISKGDSLKLINDPESSKMAVLDENGTPQMELDGGERIFSRPNTKILIKFAKKAAESKKDSDYKALGTRVFKFLQGQEDRDPEYVSNNNNSKNEN